MARRINWQIVLSNLTEAREELQQLEAMASDRNRRHEVKLEVGLSHAYHHLNFAWHIRHVKTSRYRHLTNQEFGRWGKFPTTVRLMGSPPTVSELRSLCRDITNAAGGAA